MTSPRAHTFHTLDAMRGVAALAVVCGHTQSWLQLPEIFPRYYLAVDLFFALSGFVLAKAYDERLRDGLPVRRFAAMRLTRLLPLIALGNLFGFLILLARHSGIDADGHPIAVTLTALLLNALTIPGPGGDWPFNPPTWSLFYELIANLVFASAHRRLGTRALLAIATLALVGLVSAALVEVTPGLWMPQFLSPLSRVALSFSIGVLLFRHRPRWAAHVPAIPPLATLLLTALAFCVQVKPGFVPVYDGLFVVLLSPLLIAIGSRTEPRTARGTSAFVLLGRLSYPAYALHSPVRKSIALLLSAHGLATRELALATFVLVVAIAWLATVFYDEPVRRWLTSGAPR